MSYNYNCNCNKQNEKPNNCGAKSSVCCNGMTHKFNVGKAKAISAFIDRIYDDKEGTGSPIFHSVATNTTDYVATLVLKPVNENCCTTCSVGAGALFFIDNPVCVTLKDIQLVSIPTVTQVLVNGAPVSSLTSLGDSEFIATLQSSNIIDVLECDTTEGRVSTLLLDTVGPWTYMANYSMTGTMNYNGQSCKFEANFKAINEITPDTPTSTLIVQNLCIPSKYARINFSIGGNISVINPMITYDIANTIPVLTANVVIMPTIDAEVIQNTEVCIQAIIED